MGKTETHRGRAGKDHPAVSSKELSLSLAADPEPGTGTGGRGQS